MTSGHEPECRFHKRPAIDEGHGDCEDCGIARRAYRRGREDAAKAVGAMIPDGCVVKGCKDCKELRLAQAAAKGWDQIVASGIRVGQSLQSQQ